MRAVRINLLAKLIIITLAFIAFIPICIAAESKQVLRKKELKVLLRIAKEPAEHRRIAEYYRQQSQRLTSEAKYHEEMGKIYEQHPSSYESKFPYGTVGLSHCHYWAALDLKEAREAQALAALHEDMAKAAEQKQP